MREQRKTWSEEKNGCLSDDANFSWRIRRMNYLLIIAMKIIPLWRQISYTNMIKSNIMLAYVSLICNFIKYTLKNLWKLNSIFSFFCSFPPANITIGGSGGKPLSRNERGWYCCLCYGCPFVVEFVIAVFAVLMSYSFKFVDLVRGWSTRVQRWRFTTSS